MQLLHQCLNNIYSSFYRYPHMDNIEIYMLSVFPVFFLLSILYILVYICQSQFPSSSHHPPPTFPPLVSIHLFSTSVSLFLPCKPVHLYHFSRFYMYVLIYNIWFSLSDLLHSIWQSLGPSTSLQMTQFCSFLWLSNIPLYICTTSSLSIHLSVAI